MVAMAANPTFSDPPEPDVLGLGLYSVADMSRLLGVAGATTSSHKVARWARDGLIEHRNHRPEYSFLDLISLRVVGWLRAEGVSLSSIRLAEEYLIAREDIDRPLATERIFTDGVNVLYEANPAIEGQITAANRAGQEVLVRTLAGVLRGVEYRDGLAARWQIRHGVIVDPRVQFGDPCVSGRSLRTAQIAGMHSAGESIERIAHFYSLSPSAIEDAISFEAALAAA